MSLSEQTGKVCLVVDARSIHAQRWAMHLGRGGVEGTVLSSRRLTVAQRMSWASNCQSFRVVEPNDPWNHSRKAVLEGLKGGYGRSVKHLLLSRSANAPGSHDGAPEGTRRLEMTLDLWAARRLARRLERLLARERHALVHALRIPYEGIAATMASLDRPVVVSTWGQDLQAQARGALSSHARNALVRCDGFMADNSFDLSLARTAGLSDDTPALVVPGNMGLEIPALRGVLARSSDPSSARRPPTIVYPRGVSAFADYNTFIRAIPEIISKRPGARIVCVGMGRDEAAVRQATSCGPQVTLREFMRQEELWSLFAEASVVVSPGKSDGLPNSVLEAIALGAVPVVYDSPSLAEALRPPVLGYVTPRGVAEDLAAAVVQALDTSVATRKQNMEITAHRFDAARSLRLVVDFYADLGARADSR